MTIATATLTTTAANVYASSGNTAITSLTLCNWSPGNVTANLFVVPSGGTAGTGTVALSSILLTSGDTYQLYAAAEKLILSNGDTIQANASATNSITVITSYTTL
jgi:hypothetical protein